MNEQQRKLILTSARILCIERFDHDDCEIILDDKGFLHIDHNGKGVDADFNAFKTQKATKTALNAMIDMLAKSRRTEKVFNTQLDLIRKQAQLASV